VHAHRSFSLEKHMRDQASAGLHGVRGTQGSLNLREGGCGMGQTVFHPFTTPFPTQVTQEEERQEDDGNHEEDVFLDEVQNMHDERHACRHKPGNGIPIEAEQPP
jgi:hypothetical protein